MASTVIDWIEEAFGYFTSKIDWALCKFASLFSKTICEINSQDEPEWNEWITKLWKFDTTVWKISAAVGVVALVAFLWSYVGQALPLLEANLGIIWELIEAPWLFIKNTIYWMIGNFTTFNTYLANKTGTYVELWFLLEFILASFALLEAAKSIAEWGLKKPLDSYFWRIYFFIEKPVDWLQNFWIDMFPSKWNPLNFLSWIFYYIFKAYVFILAAIINAVNPLRWFQVANKIIS